MKNIISIGIIIGCLTSCQKEIPMDYAIISGKFSNADAVEISINSTDLNIKKVNLELAFKHKINIKNDGSFLDTLKVEPGNYLLFDGENVATLYLDNGYNLVINADAKDLGNTISFSGNGSEINTYFIEKGIKEKQVLKNKFEHFGLDEDAFKAKFKSYHKVLDTLLSSKPNIAEEFKTKERRNIKYEYLNLLSSYEFFHPFFEGKGKTSYTASEGFFDELKDIDLNNDEDFLYSNDYKSLLSFHYSKKAEDLVKSDSVTQQIAYLKTVGKISNETIKNGLLMYNARDGIARTDDIVAYYEAFMQFSTNENDKGIITKKYNALKKLAKGQPSPKFINYKNHAGGSTSLDDLRGKFVFIDVWATWCGPCKAQIPFLKEIEKAYHDKNIEFVSLSVDKAADYQAWKTMVVDMELGGIQLFAENDFGSSFIKDYGIKFIPRFILIDPSGNIVSSNAPRPSDKALIDLFNELKI